jgi:putative ABC transport system substrate-binding protein
MKAIGRPSQAVIGFALTLILCALCFPAQAQQPKAYRIGVITGGGAYYETIDGLRAGLKQLGFEEGKQFVLAIRDTKGDVAKAAEEAARDLEQEKVNLIYATQTTVTIAAKRVTAHTPIVFCAGTDPVVVGLVNSFANPGGRLTGVYSMTADLTEKRLEILKDIIPKLRRVVTFYNPRRELSIESAKQAREEAQRLGIELVETRGFRRGTKGERASAHGRGG